MYKVLIWGLGTKYNQYINAIKYQEILGKIKVVGITDRNQIYKCLDGYAFFKIDDVKFLDIDFIVLTSDKYYSEILITIKSLGFDENKIVHGKIFLYPDLDFEKYILLYHQNISIISNNCWGGITYHTLGMPFLSPFINMFENDNDYIKLLKNLKYYLNCKIVFDRYEYELNLKRNYPVCKLNDIELHFNHYMNMEEVEEKWYIRCKRINWDNLFVMMFTENQNIAMEFSELDFKKKICFVPFECQYKSVYSLKLVNYLDVKSVPFYAIVNGTARLTYVEYDLIDLLLSGVISTNRLKLQ